MNRVSVIWLLMVAGLGWDVPGARAQVDASTPGYFPFVISPLDTTESFVDMSFLNPEPAGAAGRVTIQDGRFVDGHGKRVRLLGSNVTFAGAFPDKNLAPRIAGHLRKLGVNVMRFHHMDGRVAPAGVWRRDDADFDSEQLDRLDWFIFQLKQHGIYSNINLHVSRTYPGIPSDVPRAFRYGKGLDNFYPEFIALQREYARRLLTHHNPYTQTTYAKEPAIIVVELNNENSLTDKSWRDLRQMPEPYRTELTRQWNAWLNDRYGSTERVRTRWNEGSEPLGQELLRNTDLSGGLDYWTLEQGGGAKMEVDVIQEVTANAGRAFCVRTQKPGAATWNLQFHQRGLNLEAGRTYTLSYRARSNQARRLGVAVRLDQPPWSMCGLSTEVAVTTAWKPFVHMFKCIDPVPDHVRLSFNFSNQIGQFDLADVSLRPGGLIGLPADQSLEAGNITFAPTNASDAQKADFYQFLSDTECSYVRDMMEFVKNDLGVESLICDTQVSYGGLQGMVREGALSDFMDMHAYWQHPRFPGVPWDGRNWNIPNTSMVTATDGGTLGSRAWFRMVGKPFTVSEYDHPAPNDFAVELFPLLASFAAYQDWDGLYQFTYSSRSQDYDSAKIQSYFELCCHPGKKAFLPIAAVMFRMGAVRPGGEPVLVTLPTEGVAAHLAVGNPGFPSVDLRATVLQQPVAFQLKAGSGPPQIPSVKVSGDRRTAVTGEIEWDVSAPERAIYTVNSPAVRAAVGFIGGRELTLGDVSVHVTKAERDWACLAIGALDGKPLAESSRILIAAAGRTENSRMGWNDDRTSVGADWGSAPTIVEGIDAVLTLPAGAQIQTLDQNGHPQRIVPVRRSPRGVEFEIGAEYQTLWYAVTK